MVEGARELFTAAAEGTPVKHCCWEPLNLWRRKKRQDVEWDAGAGRKDLKEVWCSTEEEKTAEGAKKKKTK